MQDAHTRETEAKGSDAEEDAEDQSIAQAEGQRSSLVRRLIPSLMGTLPD